MKRILIVLVLALQVPLIGSTRIILFKISGDEMGQMEPNELQLALTKANAKSIEQLVLAIGGRSGAAVGVKDLWLVRGATADLSDAQVHAIAQQPFVSAIYDDQKIEAIQPDLDLQVTQGLSRGARVWGLDWIGVKKIRAEYPNVTGKGVRVGILDTGIEAKHTELVRRRYNAGVWNYKPQSIVTSFRDFVSHLDNPYDDHGHGTHVAGTIAGRSVGVAPNTELVVGKILTGAGYGMWSWILDGMQWMVDPDGNPNTNDAPRLVSNSWGGGIGLTGGAADITSILPLWRAVRAWKAFGIAPVFAAGNSGHYQKLYPHNSIPAGLPEAIAVGAFDSTGSVAYFSTRGPATWKISDEVVSYFKPQVSAPGVGVISAFIGKQYATWSGTSMATPHVSGALALLYQVRPKTTVSEALQLLISTSVPKNDLEYGHGTLDAYQLVKKSLTRYY